MVSVDRKKNCRRYGTTSSKIECLWSTYLPDSPRATKERNAAMLFNPTVYLIHQHYPLACRNLLRRARARVCSVNIDAPLGTSAEKIKVSQKRRRYVDLCMTSFQFRLGNFTFTQRDIFGNMYNSTYRYVNSNMADFNELITCMISLVSINFIISSNYSEKELIKVQIYHL